MDLQTEEKSGQLVPTAASVTMEGRRLAQIHHEFDLLVAQCLRRGIWDDLDPAELAAAASTCVFENRRESDVDSRAEVPTEPRSATASPSPAPRSWALPPRCISGPRARR